MTQISRRATLGALAVGLVGVAAGVANANPLSTAPPAPARRLPVRDRSRPGLPRGANPVAVENRLPGSQTWRVGYAGTRAADDLRMQVQGYASAASVNIGEPVEFHVRAAPEDAFTISIYRLGYYGGAGARHLITSPTLRGVRQPMPKPDEATGLISCDWAPVWRLDVPPSWLSGAYLAVFTTNAGWRSCTPFVVRDDQRAAGFCVILPFSTYQAYNQWPLDGRLGKSLYNGYEVGRTSQGRLSYARRAVKVSFDRPYARAGLPSRFDRDHDFVRWTEQAGYDVTYATSIDLHTGIIDPARYAGLIFCGHDEYWSTSMRDVATSAVAQGTSLGFMTANNVYWHVRYEASNAGRDNRVVVCYKSDPDPAAGRAGATEKWRGIHRDSAEQRLLGVQYNGIVASPAPLVVWAADHWFWAGCGVKDGDRIESIVAGEADGLDPNAPRPGGVTQTLLSASPYLKRDGTSRIQNTSVYETPQGAVVFVAATLDWVLGLGRAEHRDRRIETATTNLLDRMLRPQAGSPDPAVSS